MRKLLCGVLVGLLFLSFGSVFAGEAEKGLKQLSAQEQRLLDLSVDAAFVWIVVAAHHELEKTYKIPIVRPVVRLTSVDFLVDHDCFTDAEFMCTAFVGADGVIYMDATYAPWESVWGYATLVHELARLSQLFTAGKTRDSATCEDWALWEREASILDRKWLKEEGGSEGAWWLKQIAPVPEFVCDADGRLLELAPQ